MNVNLVYNGLIWCIMGAIMAIIFSLLSLISVNKFFFQNCGLIVMAINKAIFINILGMKRSSLLNYLSYLMT